MESLNPVSKIVKFSSGKTILMHCFAFGKCVAWSQDIGASKLRVSCIHPKDNLRCHIFSLYIKFPRRLHIYPYYPLATLNCLQDFCDTLFSILIFFNIILKGSKPVYLPISVVTICGFFPQKRAKVSI